MKNAWLETCFTLFVLMASFWGNLILRLTYISRKVFRPFSTSVMYLLACVAINTITLRMMLLLLLLDLSHQPMRCFIVSIAYTLLVLVAQGLGNNLCAVGLTGGIASGKSSVSKILASRGVTIIDADVIAREVVRPGRVAYYCIRAAFGREVFSADGSIDRVRLVLCTTDQQLERIMKRDQMPKDEALHRMASQMPLETKAMKADCIIDNSGPQENLEDLVSKCLEKIIHLKNYSVKKHD